MQMYSQQGKFKFDFDPKEAKQVTSFNMLVDSKEFKFCVQSFACVYIDFYFYFQIQRRYYIRIKGLQKSYLRIQEALI